MGGSRNNAESKAHFTNISGRQKSSVTPPLLPPPPRVSVFGVCVCVHVRESGRKTEEIVQMDFRSGFRDIKNK